MQFNQEAGTHRLPACLFSQAFRHDGAMEVFCFPQIGQRTWCCSFKDMNHKSLLKSWIWSMLKGETSMKLLQREESIEINLLVHSTSTPRVYWRSGWPYDRPTINRRKRLRTMVMEAFFLGSCTNLWFCWKMHSATSEQLFAQYTADLVVFLLDSNSVICLSQKWSNMCTSFYLLSQGGFKRLSDSGLSQRIMLSRCSGLKFAGFGFKPTEEAYERLKFADRTRPAQTTSWERPTMLC